MRWVLVMVLAAMYALVLYAFHAPAWLFMLFGIWLGWGANRIGPFNNNEVSDVHDSEGVPRHH